MCMYVCMLAYNSGTGRVVASKFSGQLCGAPGITLGTKQFRVVGMRPKKLHFSRCTGVGLLGTGRTGKP